MLINKNEYLINNKYPNTNWADEEGYFIIDETTEDGKRMAQMYIENYPLVDFEHDGEFVTKVIVLEKPSRPPDIVGKRIELVKNDLREWEYVYVDIPLTKEELRIKELEQQLLEVQQYIINKEAEELLKQGGM
ncbi:hypothetical protein KQI38_05475 [Tissierella carlieri]|uniref:hypothetical protein n=1 Tax=Tissierella carlieri TaxID=689904 RepID=UPI001C114F54|nr:hypothetical protein [Tissierella carlieri]MBU5311471.1 hypothetical protein [Tissierella carlieri]